MIAPRKNGLSDEECLAFLCAFRGVREKIISRKLRRRKGSPRFVRPPSTPGTLADDMDKYEERLAQRKGGR